VLIGCIEPQEQRRFWIMPGGGIEPGETAAEAATREVAEETGIDLPVDRLAGPVWEREHTFTWDGRRYSYEEQYFVARLDGPVELRPFHGDQHEARHTFAMQWVSQAELDGWPDALAPRDLADLLPAILDGDLPHEPIVTGV